MKLAQDNSGDWADPANWPTRAQWDAMGPEQQHEFAAAMGIYAYTFMKDDPDRSIQNPAILSIAATWWADNEAVASKLFYATCGADCSADESPVSAGTAIMSARWFYSYDQISSQYEATQEAGNFGMAFIYGSWLMGYVGMSDPGFHLSSNEGEGGGAGGSEGAEGSAPEGSLLGEAQGEAQSLGAAESGGVGRGGAGPVMQGQAGVNAWADSFEASGGQVLGREVTLDVDGVRTRLDLYVKFPDGSRGFVEVKTGPTADRTTNQALAIPGIEAGGAVPAGARAAEALLRPGIELPPTTVTVVHLPWPLP